MVNHRNMTIFAKLKRQRKSVKYTELHNRFKKAGWKFDHAEGSHYYYVKDGIMSEPIPYHGAHEMPKFLSSKFIKRYEI